MSEVHASFLKVRKRNTWAYLASCSSCIESYQ